MAEAQELDLVEVSPNSVPPVCRIMDYGKYKYEQSKREKEALKKHHNAKLKEIRIRPHIDEHDYQTKLQHAKEFLEHRDKVKVSMFFRGREIIHHDKGMVIIKKFIDDLKDYGAIESYPRKLGKLLLATVGPVSKTKSKKPKKVSAEAKPKAADTPKGK